MVMGRFETRTGPAGGRRLSGPAGDGGGGGGFLSQRGRLALNDASYDSALTPQALENYHKADADLNLSRAEVEKQKMNSSLRDQQCEDNKNEYANQLQKTNDLQV